MQLKYITCKTELQLMSIRSKHWKNTSCSLGINMAKIKLTSVVNHKWEMKNYEITKIGALVFYLHDCVTCYIIIFIILFIYVIRCYTNKYCRFYFQLHQEKNPSVFPHNFSNLSQKCYEDRIEFDLELHELYIFLPEQIQSMF